MAEAPVFFSRANSSRSFAAAASVANGFLPPNADPLINEEDEPAPPPAPPPIVPGLPPLIGAPQPQTEAIVRVQLTGNDAADFVRGFATPLVLERACP